MTTKTLPKVLCPVAEVAGDKHYFTPGTGEVVEWHIMGDPRTEVEVCSSCAKYCEPSRPATARNASR